MRLQTAQPLLTQVSLAIAGLVLVGVLGALVGALFSGVASYVSRLHVEAPVKTLRLWLRGIACALISIGVDVICQRLLPDLAPHWPKYAVEASYLPWLARLAGVVGTLTVMAAAIVLVYWLDRLTAGWNRRRFAALSALILLSTAAVALKS